MSYQGKVTLISGLKQANNQNFPLVNAKDVYVDDENRLTDVLNRLATNTGGSSLEYILSTSSSNTPNGEICYYTNSEDGDIGILIASEQTTNKIYLVQQKNKTYLQFITVTNGVNYIWENIGTLSASKGGVPPEFSYNENNLNILLAENSNTIFNYDEGNLICSFQ